MENISKKIATNVSKLEITSKEEFFDYFESYMMGSSKRMFDTNHIPVLTISVCSCGKCGTLCLETNDQAITKQQTIELLEEMTKKMKSEMTKLN